jgi:dolichol-phosphate mannosyltransferase
MDATVSLIIPTYNERENIEPLLQRLGNVLSGLSYEVIFIDDNSGDGTAELANSLKDRYPVRAIVRRDRRGLASAVVDGLGQISGDVIAVMDADLQHPPEVIPSLLAKIENGADVAVASRYVPGGGCQGWSRTRQLISSGAILLAHLLLPKTRSVKDPMSGFFMFRRDVVAGVPLSPTGFKILLEILMVGRYKTVAEAPFIFVTRERGQSKLNARQQIDYLKHLSSLMKRTGEMARFIKFILVGASGVGVNEGMYLLMTRVAGLVDSLDVVAVAIGIEISIITNFVLNNYFTFADRRQRGVKAFFTHLLRFNTVSLAGAGIQVGTFFILTRFLGFEEPYDVYANLIGIAVAMLWNFLANNWWTWKPQRN